MVNAILAAKYKTDIDNLADFYIKNETLIPELLSFFDQNKNKRLQARIFWIIRTCFELKSNIIEPYFVKFTQIVNEKDLNPGVYRNLLAIFAETKHHFTDVENELICNASFDFLIDPKSPIAIKIHAMAVLEKIIVQFPELKKELIIILEDQLPFSSAGFKSRATKLLRDLQKA